MPKECIVVRGKIIGTSNVSEWMCVRKGVPAGGRRAVGSRRAGGQPIGRLCRRTDGAGGRARAPTGGRIGRGEHDGELAGGRSVGRSSDR